MIMLCLYLSGGVIYLLPYLREIYYLPMQETLQLTNTQLGVLMSVFGVKAMIYYFQQLASASNGKLKNQMKHQLLHLYRFHFYMAL